MAIKIVNVVWNITLKFLQSAILKCTYQFVTLILFCGVIRYLAHVKYSLF